MEGENISNQNPKTARNNITKPDNPFYLTWYVQKNILRHLGVVLRYSTLVNTKDNWSYIFPFWEFAKTFRFRTFVIGGVNHTLHRRIVTEICHLCVAVEASLETPKRPATHQKDQFSTLYFLMGITQEWTWVVRSTTHSAAAAMWIP